MSNRGLRFALSVVACATFFVASCGDDDPESTSQTTIVDSPTTDTQSPAQDLLKWSRIPHDESVFAPDGEAWMQSVTAGGPGFVAVGYHRPGGSTAAVWTSVDGRSWEVVPHDDDISGPADSDFEMRSVATGGPGLVAVGRQGVEVGLTDDEDPEYEVVVQQAALIWTSPDGLDWTRVPHETLLDGGDLWDVTADGPGLVAVGSVAMWESPELGPPIENAAAWASPDGITWSRSTVELDSTDEDRSSVMTSVTVGGPGLVAVGRNGESAAVWTSSDGTDWSLVPHDEIVFGGHGIQGMSSVTTGGPGLVAVGGDHGRAAVWTSPTGTEWSRVPHDDDVFGEDVNPEFMDRADFERAIRDVISTPAGLIAVGTDLPIPVIWSSEDGINWQRLPYDDAVFGRGPEEPMHTDSSAGMRIEALAFDGSRIIAVGGDQLARIAAAWVAGP